jgi:dTDP-glucose pyrophosphorylase
MHKNKEIWQKATLKGDVSIHDAIKNLDKVAIKIVLITSINGSLVGTISDGDIRRGLLRGLNLESPINDVINKSPFVVRPGLDRETVIQLMIANKIQQIPIINEKELIVGLHLWDEITDKVKRNNVMVIMAGGKGTRLMPYTKDLPKAMVQISGKPLLHHIINKAKIEGFSNFLISVFHLSDIIEDYFGNGELFGVKIDYIREDTPLGTAGALSLIDPMPDMPFVVTNTDVLSDINYGELLDFHIRHNAVGTMAVRQHEWKHPFGVVETKGVEITSLKEKPIARTHINAGVYALSPSALNVLITNSHCDMPTLFERLIIDNNLAIAYPMHEPWLDVGIPDDLKTARSISVEDSS